MKAAIYARYSTDLQRQASIADQYRLCESRARRTPDTHYAAIGFRLAQDL